MDDCEGLTPEQRCRCINASSSSSLYTGERREVHPDSNVPWRISPDPFPISRKEYTWLEALGPHLLKFYEACALLYSQSVRGIQPGWVADYLDVGKDETVRMYGRMNRFKRATPLVIRPDVIPLGDGLVISELDSVPGGIGFTGHLAGVYAKLGDSIVGGASGMVEGFAEMVRAFSDRTDPRVAIVVSDEADDYRHEMVWLADALRNIGLPAYAAHPRDLRYDDAQGLLLSVDDEWHRIDVLYRFFELFDLRNIPKSDLMLYAARKNDVLMTPPAKAHLEEKMLFAFLHHPALEPFWRERLPEETFRVLGKAFPRTWIMDPSPLPPHATIHGLSHAGRPVRDFRELQHATQRERELVIKPSGFSELAWGSRGVVIGHDIPAEDWSDAVGRALDSFDRSPHVLQEFHKARRSQVRYYDFESGSVVPMDGRARLTPYYLVADGAVRLAGMQATVCPSDKKVLHGMVDAVIAPCVVRD